MAILIDRFVFSKNPQENEGGLSTWVKRSFCQHNNIITAEDPITKIYNVSWKSGVNWTTITE